MITFLLLVIELMMMDAEDVTAAESQIWPHLKYASSSLQSPININFANAQYKTLDTLETYFPHHSFGNMLLMKNEGDRLRAEMSGAHGVVKDRPYLSKGPLLSEKYLFHEIHFHWGEDDFNGSEHLLDGKRFSLEVHIVYYHEIYDNFQEAVNHSDGLAVAAFFGKVKSDHRESDNPELKPLIDKLSELIEPGSKINASFNTEFKFLRNMFNQHIYCSYPGSLTTFPFSECVTWLIHTEPFAISSKQLQEFRQLRGKDGHILKPTVRPLQDFAGRPLLIPINRGEIKLHFHYLFP